MIARRLRLRTPHLHHIALGQLCLHGQRLLQHHVKEKNRINHEAPKKPNQGGTLVGGSIGGVRQPIKLGFRDV